jgi:hypothetical protein
VNSGQDLGSIDRRRMRRRQGVGDHGIVSTRVWPGCDVVLLDISANGALIETSHRLLPGAQIELHLATRERRTAVRGDVLRCSVARLRASGVCYRGAIAFDRVLGWFVDGNENDGYAVPTVEPASDRPARVSATRGRA